MIVKSVEEVPDRKREVLREIGASPFHQNTPSLLLLHYLDDDDDDPLINLFGLLLGVESFWFEKREFLWS